MTNVYVACDLQDDDIANTIVDGLKSSGCNAAKDVEHFNAYDRLDDDLFGAFKGTDLFIFLVSPASKDSVLLSRQVSLATAFSGIAEDMLVIGVSIDNAVLEGAQNLIYVSYDGDNPQRGVSELVRRADLFLANRAARQRKAADFAKQVEEDSAEYIDEVIKSQKQLEVRNWISGTTWYTIGFASLLAASVIGLWKLLLHTDHAGSLLWIETIQSIAIIAVLAACAKYAFVLGKSYVNESLKNSDRIHAISFGKFYLRAFGQNAGWSDVKDVFQHWNIDKQSTFSGLDASQFDPKIMETLMEAYKATLDKFSPTAAK